MWSSSFHWTTCFQDGQVNNAIKDENQGSDGYKVKAQGPSGAYKAAKLRPIHHRKVINDVLWGGPEQQDVLPNYRLKETKRKRAESKWKSLPRSSLTSNSPVGVLKSSPLDSWKHSQYLEQTKVRESVKSFVSFLFQTVPLSQILVPVLQSP